MHIRFDWPSQHMYVFLKQCRNGASATQQRMSMVLRSHLTHCSPLKIHLDRRLSKCPFQLLNRQGIQIPPTLIGTSYLSLRKPQTGSWLESITTTELAGLNLHKTSTTSLCNTLRQSSILGSPTKSLFMKWSSCQKRRIA